MRLGFLVGLIAAVVLVPACLSALVTFERTYLTPFDDAAYSVVQTRDGGYAMTGSGESGVFLTKTDTLGDVLWTRSYGNGVGYDVQVTSDGGYVIAGASSSDLLLVRTDSLGNPVWVRTYGGSERDDGNSVQQTTDGGYIVGGFTSSFGAGGTDAYLIKTDSLGNTLWTVVRGGPEHDAVRSVQETQDGGYIAAGYTTLITTGWDTYVIKTDSLGNVLWTRTYGGKWGESASSISRTTDGGYVLAGLTNSFGAGYNDVYLTKINSLGDSVWARTYGGLRSERAHSAQLTADGGFIVTGTGSSFGRDYNSPFLLRTDSLGNTLWIRGYGYCSHDEGWSVRQTADGGYVFAGEVNFDQSDIYLVKTDENGLVMAGNTSDCGELSAEPGQLGVLIENPVVYQQSSQTFQPTAPWYAEMVDSGGGVGVACQIDVDDSCNPHIGYRETSVGLKYAAKTGSTWSIQVVDTNYVGRAISIALDTRGEPHISYDEIHHWGGWLKYAHWTGTEWEFQRIDSCWGVADYTSIAIDDSGKPHIAEYAVTGGDLKFASLEDSLWDVQTVDSIENVGNGCALALQFGTIPYIAYLQSLPYWDLKLARKSGGEWLFEKPDTTGRIGLYPSIAIDRNGNPHIIHHGLDTGGIRYVRWTGSQWEGEVVDSGAQVDGDKSLALSSYGYPHMTYHDQGLDALKHAYWNGSSWTIEVVANGYLADGLYNSIAIDKNNNVHIAFTTYVDTFYYESHLWYATREPTGVAEFDGPAKRMRNRLDLSAPNPFTRSTEIGYELAKPCHVSLKVYDAAGRRACVLVNGRMKSGRHEVQWNGTDNLSRRLPGGVYFYQMRTPDFLATRKLLILR